MLLAGAAAAQQALPVRAPGASQLVTAARGAGQASLVRTGDDWLGTGRDYAARFTADGVQVARAGGARASLRFVLESVGRRSGDGRLREAPVAPARRAARDRVGRYERGSLVESYEVGDAGVEQSFTFSALPRGAGDLLVRGRLETALTVSASGAEGAGLRLANSAGAHQLEIGAVTGIDAAGASCRGALRFADGRLELRLPAAFVERAVLPLVLDPLIGPVFDVFPSYAAAWSDAAFDATTSNYLVVTHDPTNCCTFWNAYGSAVGRLVSTSGAVGRSIWLNVMIAQTGYAPRVANVNSADKFVVAFVGDQEFSPGRVFAATVDAASGAVSPCAFYQCGLSLGPGSLPDVAGDVSTGDTAIGPSAARTSDRSMLRVCTVACGRG